jgi:hypothetical protein
MSALVQPVIPPVENPPSSDIVWGAEVIGKIVNLTARQAFYALEKGHLPGRKVGGKWASSKRQLLAAVTGKA